MATGADIPPELFDHILEDVCEDAWKLFAPYMDVPNRREAIKNVTACSLVCVYWAQVCRERLFVEVSIKNYKDMRAFSSLVLNTPRRFQPISDHVKGVHLEHRIGDRPWIYLLQMQPSLFLFQRDVVILIQINNRNSVDAAVPPQCLTYRRLFTGLPRTPPSSCLHCRDLTIGNAHFATPHDLASLTSRLAPSVDLAWSLTFDSITWDPQTRFESEVLTNDPLEIQEEHRFHVSIRHSEHIAKAAWLAFITPFRHILHHSRKQIWRILPPALRAILGICTLLSRGTSASRKVPSLDISYYRQPNRAVLFKDRTVNVKAICNVHNTERGSATAYHCLSLGFFYASVAGYSGPILTVEHISILCINVYNVSAEPDSETPSASGDSPTSGMQDAITYPWEDIVGLCAEHEGFMRLQLTFGSYDDMAQFMQAQRAALTKLDGRICLFNGRYPSRVVAIDFDTLRVLPGDAESEHGYIWHYWH